MAITPPYNNSTVLPISNGGITSWSQNAGVITAANTSSTVKELAIKGDMVTYTMTVPIAQWQSHVFSPDDVKRQMINGLLDVMMKTKKIEFTKMENHSTGQMIFHARLFVVPDEMVRLLRINNIKT